MTCSPWRTPSAATPCARRARRSWNARHVRRRSPSMTAGASGFDAAWLAIASICPHCATQKPMADVRSGKDPVMPRELRPLVLLAAFALICAGLWFAREVLIPIAFASLMALVLTPLVEAVQRRGVHRVAAVLLVAVFVCSVIGAAVWVLAQQVATIANDLPQYRHEIHRKIADVRVFQRSGSIGKMQETVREVAAEAQRSEPAQAPRPQPVTVTPSERPFWQLPSTLGAVATTAATVGFVTVLIVFMLLERQELRNRPLRRFAVPPAVSRGWTKPLLGPALFAVLERLIGGVVEPLLYGHSIGVSQTALLVAIAFWTWIWGPLGLILATPLTVCLVVVGKYVPDLEFILTLVSDRPVLTPDVAYYQRLLAADLDEAAEIAEAQLAALGMERLYDEVMLPAMM